MIDYPKTIEDAKKYKYGVWGGSPKGRSYKEGFCAFKIWRQGAWHPAQCSRKNGYGINNLYCKQHSNKVSL